jgi:hypothetical protein
VYVLVGGTGVAVGGSGVGEDGMRVELGAGGLVGVPDGSGLIEVGPQAQRITNISIQMNTKGVIFLLGDRIC